MKTIEANIRVTINGDERQIRGGQTVADLLTALDLHPRLVVVEHNREILDRTLYDRIEVHDGDMLELVHFVGGG